MALAAEGVFVDLTLDARHLPDLLPLAYAVGLQGQGPTPAHPCSVDESILELRAVREASSLDRGRFRHFLTAWILCQRETRAEFWHADSNRAKASMLFRVLRPGRQVVVFLTPAHVKAALAVILPFIERFILIRVVCLLMLVKEAKGSLLLVAPVLERLGLICRAKLPVGDDNVVMRLVDPAHRQRLHARTHTRLQKAVIVPRRHCMDAKSVAREAANLPLRD